MQHNYRRAGFGATRIINAILYQGLRLSLFGDFCNKIIYHAPIFNAKNISKTGAFFYSRPFYYSGAIV